LHRRKAESARARGEKGRQFSARKAVDQRGSPNRERRERNRKKSRPLSLKKARRIISPSPCFHLPLFLPHLILAELLHPDARHIRVEVGHGAVDDRGLARPVPGDLQEEKLGVVFFRERKREAKARVRVRAAISPSSSFLMRTEREKSKQLSRIRGRIAPARCLSSLPISRAAIRSQNRHALRRREQQKEARAPREARRLLSTSLCPNSSVRPI